MAKNAKSQVTALKKIEKYKAMKFPQRTAKALLIDRLLEGKQGRAEAATEPTPKPKTILRQDNPEWLWHVILLRATKLT